MQEISFLTQIEGDFLMKKSRFTEQQITFALKQAEGAHLLQSSSES